MENKFTGYNIIDDKRCCLSFSYARTEVNELFDALPDQGITFDDAVKRVTIFCLKCRPFKFREEKPHQGETVDAFHRRWQQLAKASGFKEKDVDYPWVFTDASQGESVARRSYRITRSCESIKIIRSTLLKNDQSNFVNSDPSSEEELIKTPPEENRINSSKTKHQTIYRVMLFLWRTKYSQ